MVFLDHNRYIHICIVLVGGPETCSGCQKGQLYTSYLNLCLDKVGIQKTRPDNLTEEVVQTSGEAFCVSDKKQKHFW